MGIMEILLIGAILVIIVLSINISYKKHCIDDLEISKSRLAKKQVAEILDLLHILRRILVNYTQHSTRDTQLRRFIDENEEKYMKIYQTKQKELNIPASKHNV